MKRRQSQTTREVYGYPDESELPVVMTQKRFTYLSFGCLAVLGVYLYFSDRGFSMTPVAAIVLLLLCFSILARLVSAFGDRLYIARRGRVIRGGYGITYALIHLGAELIIAILLAAAING
jgi:hypothetical protein